MPEKVKKGWTRVAFGDVVQLCRERAGDPGEGGFDRYVGLEHLEPGDLKIRRWGNVADGTTFTNVFRAGQVLFGKRRAYQRKVALADFDGVCSGDIYVLEAKGNRLLPELLPFICQTDRFFEHAVGTSAGSLSPRTNWESLADFEFALPPLEEQRRIAEVIQAAARLTERWRAVVHHLASLVSALVDVPNNRELQRLPLVTKDLGELAEITKLAGFEYTKFVKYRPDGEVIAIRPLNIKGGRLVLEDVQTIDRRTSGLLPRSKVKAGDVLITYIGEYVGEVLLIEESEKYHLAPNIARITSHGAIMPRLLERLLRGSDLQRQIASRTTTTATPSLTMSSLRKLRITFPSNVEDQRHLVDQVNAVDSASEEVKSRLVAARGLEKRISAETMNGA
ncbi:MAG TPA: restriction endonuclease subunit S [Kiritimatiellia bacterium]|nr:restriction endonuclease subunit S [Kiritimatiellia bacterium]HRZ10888.1 restriction endonuclease subunit S [Kiritimatiellia bacterium]HSA18839.1 restriction endonuclease subunit S [Kiritimatiellia bacterium]